MVGNDKIKLLPDFVAVRPVGIAADSDTGKAVFKHKASDGTTIVCVMARIKDYDYT
jgi:hypothetical protein